MKLQQIVPMTLAAGLLAACSQGMAASNTQSMAASADPMPASVTVGGQAMLPGKDIVDNAVNSADHTTLVAAVKAAGLVDTLKSPGPFTVFAPTNEAFAELPAGTVPNLLKPANKATLTKVLTYHVVPGRLTFDSLHKMAMDMGGKAELTTVEGGKLTVMANGPHNLVLIDAKGDVAHISTYDVNQSNGEIQVIDKVMLPG
jgi:uncharacterized surface protein with fasciclin (FAS1) repeats